MSFTVTLEAIQEWLDDDLSLQTLKNQYTVQEIYDLIENIDEITNDFYNKYDPFEVTILDKEEFSRYRDSSVVEPREKEIYNANLNYYEIKFSNVGGLVMPIILQLNYEDGTNFIIKMPAEIWKMNRKQITKIVATKKKVSSFTLDPKLETADIDLLNNHWPRKMIQSRFELYKSKNLGRGQSSKENKMQRAKRAKKKLAD